MGMRLMVGQNKYSLITSLAIGILCCGFSPSTETWQKAPTAIMEGKINYLAIHSPKNQIFLATPQGLYNFNPETQSSQAIGQSAGGTFNANYIYISTLNSNQVYAATDSGLLESKDGGETWQMIYDPQEAREKQCLSVLGEGETIFIGTAHGLFYRSIENPQWTRFSGELGDTAIYELAKDSQYFYVATDSNLYRWKGNKQSIKKIFSVGSKETETETEAIVVPENPVFVRKIKDLVVSGVQRKVLFLATSRGIFRSHNSGKDWSRISTESLPLDAVSTLLALPISEIQSTSHGKEALSPDDKSSGEGFRLLAATTKGVYELAGNIWQPVYQGLETNDIRHLAIDPRGNIYAAADKGLFVLNDSEKLESSNRSPASSTEPTIREVQELAIKYADVHPDKIRNWYKASRQKALLPHLSAGLGRNDGELLHWDSGANPDALVKGRETLDWDVTLTWDFSDLIWSSDFTSIDSRAKLMAELREDILDQVTRLYFERRRIQVELINNAQIGVTKFQEKQMRIEELTALIDALTGGEFSRRVEKVDEGEEM